jgi:inhibitor of cysteine peptidase
LRVVSAANQNGLELRAMQKLRSTACAIVAAIVLPLLAPVCLHAGATSTINLTADDNGRTVTLVKGGVLVVSLSSIPGTGFGWIVSHIDASMLQQQGEPQLIHSAPPIPGSPAQQVFRFSAIGRGSTTIELVYVRPWEHGVPPARTFHVAVRVR